MYKELVKVFDGGKGSGHFNHVGIPNHKGGSARSGEFYKNINTNKVNTHKMSGDNRLEKIKSVIKKKKNESDEGYYARVKSYSESIVNYTGNRYGDIKNAYRAKYGISKEYYGKMSQEKAEKASNDLDDYIYQAPKYDGEVYRGMTLSDENYDNIIKNLESGKIMDMQGISSWSSNKAVSEDFIEGNLYSDTPNAILFKLQNKSGTPIDSISYISGEYEVLHPTTARYKLKKIEENDNNYFNAKRIVMITLEEV